MADMLRFSELTARKNFPHGVPEDVDENARFYQCDAGLHGRERDWAGILAVPEHTGNGPVFTHFYLADGFRRGSIGPEVDAVYGNTALYRKGLRGIFEKRFGVEVEITR